MSARNSVHSWVNGKFTLRSGFYAGRGVNSGDLNSKILEMFYQGIKRDLGDHIATNFVRFANKLRDLSASAFIVAFEQFWANDCTVTDIAQQSEDRNQLSGHGDALIGEAFGLIGAILGGGNSQSDAEIKVQSFFLKREFIASHKEEIPEDEINVGSPTPMDNVYGDFF